MTKLRQYLAEVPGDVALGLFVLGFGKQIAGAAEFDQFSLEEKHGVIGKPRGLLHVVRDNNDRVLAVQFQHQVFDSGGGSGVQRGCRFIKQDLHTEFFDRANVIVEHGKILTGQQRRSLF